MKNRQIYVKQKFEAGEVSIFNLTLRDYINTQEELQKYQSDIERAALMCSRLTLVDGKKIEPEFLIDSDDFVMLEFIFESISIQTNSSAGFLKLINS